MIIMHYAGSNKRNENPTQAPAQSYCIETELYRQQQQQQ